MEQPEILERYAAINRAVHGAGDLDAAIADVHRLPAGLPGRGALAAGLIVALMRVDPSTGGQRLHHLDGLLTIADSDPPTGPQWPQVRAGVRAIALMQAGADHAVLDPRAALAELDTLAEQGGDSPAVTTVLESARMAMTFLRAVEDGDESMLQRMPQQFEKLQRLYAGNADAAAAGDLVARAVEVMATQQRGGDVWEALDRLRESADQLPAGHHLHAVMAEMTTMLSPYRGVTGDGVEPGPATEAQLAAMAALAQRPDLGAPERALYHAGTAGAALGLGEEIDPARVEQGVRHLRAAVDLAGPDNPQRVFYLHGLALGLYRRSELTNAVDDLDEAAGLLEQARRIAGGPGHQLWSTINELLSHVRRRRGGTAPPRKGALEGLQGYAWKVLLQSDLAATNLALRGAARDALEIARMCLADGDPADAVQALDAGRGLALFAATEAHRVGSRLAAANNPELAERWQRAQESGDPAELSTHLRREVWQVLSTGSDAVGLLGTPGLGEIRAALRTLQADALVYLVAGERSAPGFAVAVPVEGPPSYLALPNLLIEHDLDVERYLTALARRDAVIVATEPDPPGFADSLDSLCDWAWRAAIGPLVQAYLPGLTRPYPQRPPRMVLVPMGLLARIPWQAARDGDGRYAVQRVAVSQAASARMLCHSASLAPVPGTPVGMVVGDPDTGRRELDLAAAGLEAYAIHQTFYRTARYVGRRPDGTPSRSGAGTVEQVRDWLTGTGPGAGPMLHLACHGFVRADQDAGTSYLLLAGGGRLTAEELIDLMARSPQRAVGLVVLAACRTGLSINGYDEAYSLGTAFLAGGARTVLSTQWGIPDRATSVLMFMFHHYLMTDGLPAWAALRQAQLWMLDPRREFPDRMPAPLRAMLIDDELPQVVAWAGFIHSGQ